MIARAMRARCGGGAWVCYSDFPKQRRRDETDAAAAAIAGWLGSAATARGTDP
jgi:hypothetical protein